MYGIVSYHMIEVKQHKTAHFEVSHHDILLLTAKNTVWVIETFITSPPGGVWNIEISMSLCLLVCTYVCPLASLENHMSKLRKIFVHVAYGRLSVLLIWQYSMLWISGFVDDIFTHNHNGSYVIWDPAYAHKWSLWFSVIVQRQSLLYLIVACRLCSECLPFALTRW